MVSSPKARSPNSYECRIKKKVHRTKTMTEHKHPQFSSIATSTATMDSKSNYHISQIVCEMSILCSCFSIMQIIKKLVLGPAL